VCCLEKGKPEERDAKQEFGEIEFGNDQESDILAPECQQAKDLISFPLFDVIHLGENLYHGQLSIRHVSHTSFISQTQILGNPLLFPNV
jgi:hypothetical protein